MKAIFVGSVNLGTAGPDNYTLLTINAGTTLTLSNESEMVGNVGVLGGAGKLSMSGDAHIDGKLFLSGLPDQKTHWPATGFGLSRADTIQMNADLQLQQARTDALAASTKAAALVTNIAGPPITGDPPSITKGFGQITLAGGSGTNVLNLQNFTLGNTDVLTLSAPAGGSFIINVSNEFKIDASTTGGKIVLAGGLTPLNVLYNVIGPGIADVAFTGGSTNHMPNAQISGILLAPDRSVKFTPGIVFGEIISGGQELTLTNGGIAFSFTSPIPEMSAFLPLASVLSIATGFQLLRRRSAKR